MDGALGHAGCIDNVGLAPRRRNNPQPAGGRCGRLAPLLSILALVLGLVPAPGAQAQQTHVTVGWGSSRHLAGEGGEPAVVALRLNKAPGRQVTIELTSIYSSGATAADHSPIPSRVVFGPTDTVRYLLVRAIDDALDDDGTTVFGEGVGLIIGTPSPGSGVSIPQ